MSNHPVAIGRGEKNTCHSTERERKTKKKEKQLKFVLLTIITDIVVAKFYHKTWKNMSNFYFILYIIIIFFVKTFIEVMKKNQFAVHC